MPACLQRYLAGERIEVWNELMALGEAVRSKPAPAGVNAVIDETMRRARHNIEVLIPRLSGMGYRFAAPAIERELQKIDKQIAEPKINPYVLKLRQKAVAEGRMPASMLNPRESPGFQEWMAGLQEQRTALEAELERTATMPPIENPRVYYEPEPESARNFRVIEKLTKGPLPLSLRSWYRHVGYVSFAGSHPVLNPAGSATAAPLVVRPVAEIMMGVPIVGSVAEFEEELVRARQKGKTVLTISESDLSKAGLEGGKPYTVWLPEPSADVELESPWGRNTFVGYLRSAFEWGRFPGGTRLVAAARHDRRTY